MKAVEDVADALAYVVEDAELTHWTRSPRTEQHRLVEELRAIETELDYLHNEAFTTIRHALLEQLGAPDVSQIGLVAA